MSSTSDNPSKPAEKLIFAPANNTNSTQANQAQQYTTGTLSLSDLSPSPLTQFHAWYTAALHPPASTHPPVHQPETCTLATASLPSGAVSARLVYLKELDGRGFVIYSNTGTSRKAADLAGNPRAALAFWWREAERQVRVEGKVEPLARPEAQAYFDTRARGSRVGAWASAQSTVTGGEGGGREELEERVAEVERRFEGEESIPVPEFWGGLRVVPEVVEFWQGRESRLHDRFRYTRVRKEGEEGGEGEWKIERLMP